MPTQNLSKDPSRWEKAGKCQANQFNQPETAISGKRWRFGSMFSSRSFFPGCSICCWWRHHLPPLGFQLVSFRTFKKVTVTFLGSQTDVDLFEFIQDLFHFLQRHKVPEEFCFGYSPARAKVYTLEKSYLKTKTGGLEDDFPFQMSNFLSSMLIFRGLWWYIHLRYICPHHGIHRHHWGWCMVYSTKYLSTCHLPTSGLFVK